jgi:hypothetical protein
MQNQTSQEEAGKNATFSQSVGLMSAMQLQPLRCETNGLLNELCNCSDQQKDFNTGMVPASAMAK